jgi:hypothetical protein
VLLHFGLRPWLCGSTKEPNGFMVNHWKPCELGVASCQSPLMTWPPRSPDSILALRLNQGTVHDFVLLSATMRPALDSAGHRVPRTKPTYLLHTWRPHWHRPFTLVLHLHQHQSNRNQHLQYLAKSQSTQCYQSLIISGSDHPPVLEPHRLSGRCGPPLPTREEGGGDEHVD